MSAEVNWDAIGAIAEMLGALGVIATLLYLATQIRQSKKLLDDNARFAAHAARTQTYEDLGSVRKMLAADPELASIWSMGCAGESLDVDEAFRFDIVAEHYGKAHAQVLYRRELHPELSDSLMEALAQFITGNPGFRDYWNRHVPESSSIRKAVRECR